MNNKNEFRYFVSFIGKKFFSKEFRAKCEVELYLSIFNRHDRGKIELSQ